jgi:GDP-4-dehydro-6-deoxy-D-mannose reductase
VCSDFAKQIADIEKGRREPILRVGNLDARRDFTDVRDIVKGYWLALEKGEPGEEYNLCSGRAWVIKDMLDYLLKMSKAKIRVETDPARLRPSDVQVLLGDASKFKKATGWEPKIPFEQTLEDMLAYWRER